MPGCNFYSQQPKRLVKVKTFLRRWKPPSLRFAKKSVGILANFGSLIPKLQFLNWGLVGMLKTNVLRNSDTKASKSHLQRTGISSDTFVWLNNRVGSLMFPLNPMMFSKEINWLRKLV